MSRVGSLLNQAVANASSVVLVEIIWSGLFGQVTRTYNVASTRPPSFPSLLLSHNLLQKIVLLDGPSEDGSTYF